MKNDFTTLINKINEVNNVKCFTIAKKSDVSYLKSLKLPNEIVDFYLKNNPIGIIEHNEIRLLPISEMKVENNDSIPGCILSPLGYYIIASTLYGDVYCVQMKNNKYSIYIASHDEIDEETEDIEDGIIYITNSFHDFLKKFVESELVSEYYDLEE